MKKTDVLVLSVAVLGAAKLAFEAFGISGIQDDQINAIANGIAAIVSVVGVIRNNRKFV